MRPRVGAGARPTLWHARSSIDARSFIQDMPRNVMKTSPKLVFALLAAVSCAAGADTLFQPGRPGASRPQSRRGAGPLSRRQHERRRARRARNERRRPVGASRRPQGGRVDSQRRPARRPTKRTACGHKVAVKAREIDGSHRGQVRAGGQEGCEGRGANRGQTPRRTGRSLKESCGPARAPSRHRCDERRAPRRWPPLRAAGRGGRLRGRRRGRRASARA